MLNFKTIILVCLHYLPQIVYLGNKEAIVTIKRKLNKNQYYEIKVNKENGYFIEITKGFSDILKFDQTTFSNEKKIVIDNVGYWNILNQYTKPLSKPQ